jgi:hypothetical protein
MKKTRSFRDGDIVTAIRDERAVPIKTTDTAKRRMLDLLFLFMPGDLDFHCYLAFRNEAKSHIRKRIIS